MGRDERGWRVAPAYPAEGWIQWLWSLSRLWEAPIRTAQRPCPFVGSGRCRLLPTDEIGHRLGATSEASEATQRLVDDEVRRLIARVHREVTDLLTAHREELDNLVVVLLQANTLDGIDAYRAAGMPM